MPEQVWKKLDNETKELVFSAFKKTRSVKPGENNWVLFASIIEAFLLENTGEYDEERLLHGVNRFRNDWYKGDSLYGDGKDFHMDYYNSLIHTLFTEILSILNKHNKTGGDFYETQLKRHIRYAELLERFISPEGTFPVVGRSITGRIGIFHALAQIALMKKLPERVSPPQARSALTAVMSYFFKTQVNFDEKGWLRVGFMGSQLKAAEGYANTGSSYSAVFVMLPLGLPPNDPFWSGPYTEWTSLRAWNGKDFHADHYYSG
jgi:hypothetical protein